MTDWLPMASAPLDGTRIRVKLSNGRETVAECWVRPTDEHGPGWGMDCSESFFEDTMDEDEEADMVGWKPCPPEPAIEPPF